MGHSDDADSRVVAGLDRIGDRLAGLGRSERTERLDARSRRVVTNSYLYR